MDNRPGGRLPKNILIIVGGAGLLALGGLAWVAQQSARNDRYPMHHNVKTTVFWVGEGADASNSYIHNRASTWTEDWVGAYGGIDNPTKRCGLLPCDFDPKENPFYFALPYNDLDESCNAKPSQKNIPWFNTNPGAGNSIIKNQWIEVRFGEKIVYAQWEDAGPFGEDDTNYVFGNNEPKAKAGLDLSPATAGYLDLDGVGQTDWRFIPEESVPKGPWRQTITKSPPDCTK